MNIPLATPDITEAKIQAVVEGLKTFHLALGPKLKEVKGAIAEHAGVRYVMAVNSGTSALHLVIRDLEIGTSDEVIDDLPDNVTAVGVPAKVIKKQG